MNCAITYLSNDDIHHLFKSNNFEKAIKDNPYVKSIPENISIDTDITPRNSEFWKSSSSVNRFGMKYLQTLNYVRSSDNFLIAPVTDSILGCGYVLRDKYSYIVSSRFKGEFIISPRSNHITVMFFNAGLSEISTFSRSFKLLLSNFEASILKVINYCIHFNYQEYLLDKQNSAKQSDSQYNLSIGNLELTWNVVKINRLAFGGRTVSEYVHQKINTLQSKARSETNPQNRMQLNHQIKSLKSSYDLVISNAIESILYRDLKKFKFKKEFSSLNKALSDLVNDNQKYEIMTYIGADYRFGIGVKNNTKNHIV